MITPKDTTPRPSRLEHGAQGNDFVALTPGQPFDPFAELRASIARQEAEEAEAAALAAPTSPFVEAAAAAIQTAAVPDPEA